MRPARAKALIINAFALAGRFAIFNPYTQGAALGYVLFGAQWKFSGDKHKSLQVDTERTFHQRYPLAML